MTWIMKFTTQAVMVVIEFYFQRPTYCNRTSTAYNTPFGHKQADKIKNYLILAISK
jgi:hypothetical protein